MTPLYFLVLALGAAIVCIITFTIIYYSVNELITFDDAFYYAVQIQTNIGAVDVGREREIRNIVTVQSLIAFFLNVFFAALLAVVVSRVMKGKPINELISP